MRFLAPLLLAWVFGLLPAHAQPADPCSREAQATTGAPSLNCLSDEGRARTWAKEAGFGDETEKAVLVAKCESDLQVDAKNPRSTASGLYQHLASLWKQRIKAAGYKALDIFNGWHSTLMAYWLRWADGFGWRHWPNCGKVNP